MELSAIYHRTSDNWCYPIDTDSIEIKIKTGYDVQEVFLIHGDPYDGGIMGGNFKWNGKKEQIIKMKELKYHKVWTIHVKPEYKRVKYYFELHTQDECMFMFEDGFLNEEESNMPGKGLQYFIMPWLNESDVKTTPSWAASTIWYQVFPDRFARGDFESDKKVVPWASKTPSNEDVYGGDLQGIMNRLDYLRNLGINGIYLNPIFAAASTHKYDTIDYFAIDPMFGSKETFRQFVDECHKRGIRVMLDGVFNHCGKEFPLWKDVAEKGRESAYYDWFMVNEWPFDIQKDHTHDREFYSFAFYANMPKLNTNNPETMEYIVQVCEYWIREFNIDGWRLDVANEISHEMCKLIQKRCRALKPDIYILGEIWHDSIKWLQGDEFDSVMNYPLTTAIVDFWVNDKMTNKTFEHLINNCYERYMYQTNEVLFNMLDSHDTDRIFSRVHKNINTFYQQFVILFTMSGSLSVYYGSEIVMDGAHDPLNRACMPWDEIDAHKHDEKIDKMRQLIEMRHTYKAARSQEIQFQYTYGNERVIDYVKDDSLRVIINASESPIEIDGQVVFSNHLEGTTLLAGGVVVLNIE